MIKMELLNQKLIPLQKKDGIKMKRIRENLKKMKADHPVAYAENDATVGRNQAISKSGHTVGTIEIGKTSGKAYQSDDAIGTKGELKATGGDVKSKGQLGEGEAAIEVGSAKGGTEINKKHISANAEAQLIDAQAQGELGSKDNNLHGKGEAKALSANASGLLGVDGMEAKAEAVGANAGIEGGFTLSGINFDAGASVGAQAGGGVEIDARGIEVDAKFVFGGKIKITW
ncbi:hypothetical protein [Staphylococcus pettenkoferi]|uniref:hypothetical protein n=1 Tax=Staphylococcus pettenkoferi TaxID=170573 RepID=UPI002276F524|nr:hypothetical protein [Staphylococcus pettenkoferi]MCY1598296.1 hypothetical protein [Staphylococcus pettenkoferi]